MKHRLFNLLAGASLLLCIATAAMWVRSWYRYDWVVGQLGRGCVGLESLRGKTEIFHNSLSDGSEWGSIPASQISVSPPPRRLFGFGFRYYRFDANGRHLLRSLVFPDWFSLLIFASPSACLLISRRRNHRFEDGFCHACGYDLRATPNRFPECGATSEPAITPEFPPSK